MEQIELNLSGCATREELHSRIRDALDFPPYYGMNLDALFDMLTSAAAGGVLSCRSLRGAARLLAAAAAGV